MKAGVFGFLIALMGCYHGFYSKGGAQGVGIKQVARLRLDPGVRAKRRMAALRMDEYGHGIPGGEQRIDKM